MGHSQEFPPPLKISSLPISLSLTGYLDSTFRLTMAGGRGGGVPQPLRVLASAAAVLIGGFFTLSLASTATIGAIQAVTEARRGATLSQLSGKRLLLLTSKNDELFMLNVNCFCYASVQI
ncbi:uncharacterized protein LOC131320210 isoform X2 [Rhododendron vialii]|uniref:uncharacterized protein LOC131320210 isoform X2 n=1 Tax=Rhododendron vialii TaxID=182163 RepID=UPI00265F613E|nr:uncharacterized protein LOC131320210 isoform X2 [Rhododendron vialii]